MRGSCEEAANYCKKDGDYKEYGTLPAAAERSDKFTSVIRLAETGELEELKQLYPGIFVRYKRTLESLLRYTDDELVDSCRVWICGPPRCGKDYGVRQKYKSLYSKPLNKWWDGYQNEETVLISDVEPFHGSWLGFFLKIWADRYAFLGEIKGGTIKIRSKRIFVTSNFEMNKVFSGEVLQALEARFEIYDFINCPTGRHIPCPLFTEDRRVLDLLNGVDEVDTARTESLSAGISIPSVSTIDDSETYEKWRQKEIQKILLPDEEDDFQEIVYKKKKKEQSQK